MLLACTAEDANPPPASVQAPVDPRTGAPGAIAVDCDVDEAIDAATRAQLDEQARSLLGALREGKTEAMWSQLHPQARRDDQRKQFTEALEAMSKRLGEAEGETTIARMLRVDLSGGANALARVQCGEPGQPDGYSLLVNAGDEDVAVVILDDKHGQDHTATTVQLRRRGERWRLLGIQVNPSQYRGRDALAYEELATRLMSQQQVVAAFALLGVAQMLSDRGAAVKSGLHDRIAAKLAAIQRDQLFEAETGTWTVGGQRFAIEGLSLVSTRRDISPVLKYVTPQGLVEDLLGLDADALVVEVARRFPELPRHFDTIVFEAYAQAPDEPGKDYQAYRLVRYFDPSKRPAGR